METITKRKQIITKILSVKNILNNILNIYAPDFPKDSEFYGQISVTLEYITIGISKKFIFIRYLPITKQYFVKVTTVDLSQMLVSEKFYDAVSFEELNDLLKS